MKKQIIKMLLATIFVATTSLSLNAQAKNANEVWITGTCIDYFGSLCYEADKPIQGNPATNIVYLGVQKNAMQMLEILTMAKEKGVKVRLYGELQPLNTDIPAPKNGAPAPNVQYIVWKIHSPSDPDVLPASKKVNIN